MGERGASYSVIDDVNVSVNEKLMPSIDDIQLMASTYNNGTVHTKKADKLKNSKPKTTCTHLGGLFS